jgi:hypothetical protein
MNDVTQAILLLLEISRGKINYFLRQTSISRHGREFNSQWLVVKRHLSEGSCLIYVIYVCLRIVVSNTYCAVFLFCLSSSCVPYVVNFS